MDYEPCHLEWVNNTIWHNVYIYESKEKKKEWVSLQNTSKFMGSPLHIAQRSATLVKTEDLV